VQQENEMVYILLKYQQKH